MKRYVHRSLPWVLLLVLLNAAYLWSGGAPSLFYVGNVVLHVGAGFVLGILWLLLWRTVLASGSSALLKLSLLGSTALSLSTGVVLIITGTVLDYRWILWIHIAASFVAAAATMVWLVGPSSPKMRPWPRGLSIAALALFMIVPAWSFVRPVPSEYRIENPVMPPENMAGEGMANGEGIFFPSAIETADGETIPVEFFLRSQTCGEAGCHPDVYDQWESSAHHFSSFNNQFYRKSIEYMQEVSGLETPKWCAGCHDPALLLSGTMARPVEAFIDEPAAHAGLACVVCHSTVHVKNTMGNGGFVVEYPELHRFADSENRYIRAAHDYLVRLNPKPHANAFLKPFHREQAAEYCASCHKVHLDVDVNNYRWIRGFNSYDNWQASGVSGQGARSFYEPAEPMNCITCHMPLVPSDDAAAKNGMVRSHRFAAANAAVAFVNRDEKQLAGVASFLKADQVAVDIFAVSEPEPPSPPASEPVSGGMPGEPQLSSSFAIAEEEGMAVGAGSLTREATAVYGPLSGRETVLQRGTSARVEVVVRTKGVGHLFPSGTVDAQEAWLELKATDSKGDLLFWSGWVDENGTGEVDPGAHFYRNVMVDANANPVNKRNAFHTRSVVYVNLIPPGAADVAHYRLDIPDDCGEEVRIAAKLHYRKFNRYYTQFSYAGEPDPSSEDSTYSADFDNRAFHFTGDIENVSGPTKEIPDLPIITMATDSLVLSVSDTRPDPDVSGSGDAAERMRWNDYGIALFLEGDLKGAEVAFKRAVEVEPEYADGWVNLARVYLQEGALEEALGVLEEADRVRPDFYKANYFKALYYKALGEYDAALPLLTDVSERFPRDRVVLNDIGRVYFLRAEPGKAIPYLEKVLAIDSEDLTAHYNLMLCYRAIGNQDRAHAHEKRYLRYKADEDAQAIARVYRKRHPHDNNEAQPIHEHYSVPRSSTKVQR